MLSDPVVMDAAQKASRTAKIKAELTVPTPYTRSPLLDDPNYEIVADPFAFRMGHYELVYVQFEDAAQFPGLDLDGDVVKAYPKPGSPINPLIIGGGANHDKLLSMFRGLDDRVIEPIGTDYTPKPAVHPLMSKLLARAK